MQTNNTYKRIVQKACKAAYNILEKELSKHDMNEIRGVSTLDFERSIVEKINDWKSLSKRSSKAIKSLYVSISSGRDLSVDICLFLGEAWKVHKEMIECHHPFLPDYTKSLDHAFLLIGEFPHDPMSVSEIEVFLLEDQRNHEEFNEQNISSPAKAT